MTKVELNLYYVKINSYMKFHFNISKDDKENLETKFKQRAITHVKVRQTQQKSNLICIMSRQIHIQNFKSLSQKTGEISPENKIFAKGIVQKMKF